MRWAALIPCSILAAAAAVSLWPASTPSLPLAPGHRSVARPAAFRPAWPVDAAASIAMSIPDRERSAPAIAAAADPRAAIDGAGQRAPLPEPPLPSLPSRALDVDATAILAESAMPEPFPEVWTALDEPTAVMPDALMPPGREDGSEATRGVVTGAFTTAGSEISGVFKRTARVIRAVF